MEMKHRDLFSEMYKDEPILFLPTATGRIARVPARHAEEFKAAEKKRKEAMERGEKVPLPPIIEKSLQGILEKAKSSKDEV